MEDLYKYTNPDVSAAIAMGMIQSLAQMVKDGQSLQHGWAHLAGLLQNRFNLELQWV